jgi:hypothetical protein
MADEYRRDGDFIINELIIEKYDYKTKSVKQSLSIIPSTTQNILTALVLEESLFSPFVRGSLIIKETGLLFDEFNFTGEEVISIKLETPTVDNSTVELVLCAYSVQTIGDINSIHEKITFPTTTTGTFILIEFVSCEYNLLSNSEIELADEEFIGKISSDDESGLVQVIQRKYFSDEEFDAENTENAIWFRKNTKSYPWGKPEEYDQTVIQTLINLSENAVPESNSYSPNYLFWRDLKEWRFRSIESLLEEEPVKLYTPLGIESNKLDYTTKILSFDAEEDNNTLKLFEIGAFNSYYDYIKPNYENPYLDYVDVQDSTTQERIEFNYSDEFGKWNTVEENPLVQDEYTKTYNKKIKLGDNIYGYFSPKFNRFSSMPTDRYEDKSGESEEKQWQCIFDQTDLDYKKLKVIRNDIKGPIEDAKKEYRKKLNLKTKWDIYESRICCAKKPIVKDHFLAVVEESKFIPVEELNETRGGIYEYKWREVEIWPKDFIEGYEDDIETFSSDNSPLVVVGAPGGLSGSYQEQGDTEWSNPAYNINELMNTKPDGVDGEDVFVGPGINVASEKLNQYPKGHQMMPVGGYFKVGDNPCDIDHENTEVNFHEHVVQMYRMPSYVLNSIHPQKEDEDSPDPSIPKDIYFFDVMNAHDGLCRCK